VKSAAQEAKEAYDRLLRASVEHAFALGVEDEHELMSAAMKFCRGALNPSLVAEEIRRRL